MEAAFQQTITEADLDWVVCMELNANSAFRDWFSTILFGCCVTHQGAWRSVADILGESDLIWHAAFHDGTTHFALIENKINASAQPEQHDRYVARGNKYVADGKCDEFLTVLLAPRAYSSEDSRDYQKRINYEDMLEFFDSQSDERSRYLGDLIKLGIEKRARSWQAEPDTAITAFRLHVWELASARFPDIQMRKPKPCREYWVDEQYEGFTIRYKMYAKAGIFHDCVVDIELSGRGENLEAVQQQYGERAAQIGASIERASKSAVIRIHVPVVSPPDFDAERVAAALEAWSKLLEWWNNLDHERIES